MVTVSPSECEGSPTWAYTLQLPHDPRSGRIARVTSVPDPRIPPPFDRRSGPLRCAVLAGPDAEGGRGLFLVCHYAESWGGYPLGGGPSASGGKLLWCEVGVSAAVRAVATA